MSSITLLFQLFVRCPEATTGGVLWEKVFTEISQKSQENTCVSVSFLVKLQAHFFVVPQKVLWRPKKWACNFIKKETLTHIPVNFVKFLRAHFFHEHLWTSASRYPSMILKFSYDFLKLAFFTSNNKVFYFSQVNVFIGCHLSKIFLIRKKYLVLFDSKLSIFYFINSRIFIQKK